MAVGFPVDKHSVDQRAGSAALGLRQALINVSALKEWLDGESVADLVQLGYSQEEANLLKDSFTDLDSLAKVAKGQAAVPGANDFFWNAKHLIGVN